jgi:hypothetical protein
MWRRLTGLGVALLLLGGPPALGQEKKPPAPASEQEFSPYLPAPGDRRETIQLNQACRNIQNTHECAQAVEKMQLPKYPQLVSRQGGTLRLALKSGGAVELRDVATNGEKDTFYSFREYFPDLGYYLVHVQYWEGDAYLMVNYRTGERSTLHDLFLLSPNRQRLATLSLDMDAGYNPTAVQIWGITPEKLTLEYSYEPKGWGPSQGAWKDNDTLQFDKTGYDKSYRLVRQGTMVARKGSTGWRLSPAKP